MSIEHDRQHLEELIAAHTRRLRVIEVSIARKGDMSGQIKLPFSSVASKSNRT